VPDPIGGPALGAHEVVHLLPVRPCLHQARGGEHAHAHVRAEPGQPPLRIRRAELRGQIARTVDPLREQIRRA
jgi:hypothetical protein